MNWPARPPVGAALAALCATPRSSLVALDFDGTLAPIAGRPEDARPLPGAVPALRRLVAVFGTVAVVTGRPASGPVQLAGLDREPGLDGLVVLGHYGDQRWTPQDGLTGPPQHPGVARARRAIPALLDDAPAGVLLEDKGLSVAVHTRQAADPPGALEELLLRLATLADECGLQLQEGRLFVELRAPGGRDKGVALRALIAERAPEAVLFAGDDVVDLPAFEAVAEFRAGGRTGVTVFAANHEAPEEMREQADLVVDGAVGTLALLVSLAERAEAAEPDQVRAAQRRNQEQYAAVAPAYAESRSHAGGEDLAWFTERAASVTPTRALDVACGGGFSTRALIAARHRVLGTDLTHESVQAARSATPDGAPVDWAVGAAEALPLRHGSVGLVGCRIAPHHFGDPARFVDEVARVLAPGGLLLLVDTTVPEDEELARWQDEVERLRDPSHVRAWPPSRWRAVLAGAGLAVVEEARHRKRHELEPWLARAGCSGECADEVRRRFREAPPAVRAAYSVETSDDGTVVAYTDTKLCLRVTKPAR